MIQLTLNKVIINLLERFDETVVDKYDAFNMENGIVWNLIALAIEGVVFFLITLMTEIKAPSCYDRWSCHSLTLSLPITLYD